MTNSRFFLSHSSAHKAFCEDLKEHFEASGHILWLDSYDLHAGNSIPGTIVDAIYGSAHFILLVTPEVHESHWVSWELNIATYREVEELHRTYILPVRRIVCARPRLIAHKSEIDVVGCNSGEAARRILSSLSDIPLSSPSLPDEAILLVGELTHATQVSFSTRRLEEALWAAAFPSGGSYSFFPGMLKQGGLSVAHDRIIAGLDEGERQTTVELRSNGDIRIAETEVRPGIGQPILHLREYARKLAAMVRFVTQVARELSLDSPQLRVRIHGLDRTFKATYHPNDMVGRPLPIMNTFKMPVGTQLATTTRIQNGPISRSELLRIVDDLQADLFHPLRISPNPFIGGLEVSLRLTKAAVSEEVERDNDN